MPFAAPMITDDEDAKKKAQGGGGGAVNVSGQSNSFASNVPGQEAQSGSASGTSQKSSGRYANIQSYLDANKDQANQMGDKITNDVSIKADDASNKINSYGSQEIKAEAYDPTKVLGDVMSATDQDKQQYKKVKQTGGYEGPQSMDQATGYQDANQATAAAVQKVKDTGTEQGQQALLKETYARPQYSAGENKLDQVLLQNSAGSKQKLYDVGQKYAGLEGALNSANQSVGNNISAATQQSLVNKQAFNPAETQARNALMNPIQARADQANLTNSDYADRVLADASDYQLNEETLAALGLSEGVRGYGLNLSSYVTPDKTQVGVNNAANASERAKYGALSSLIEDPSMNQITSNGKEIKPVTFNQKQFDLDRAGSEAEFNRLSQAANFRGSAVKRDYEYGGDPEIYADQAVSDYLANGFKPTISGQSHPSDMDFLLESSPQEIQWAKQALEQKIQSWLQQNGYNNVIKKGTK